MTRMIDGPIYEIGDRVSLMGGTQGTVITTRMVQSTSRSRNRMPDYQRIEVKVDPGQSKDWDATGSFEASSHFCYRLVE